MPAQCESKIRLHNQSKHPYSNESRGKQSGNQKEINLNITSIIPLPVLERDSYFDIYYYKLAPTDCMDLQLKALAKLPQSDDIPEYHFVDPNRSCNRASLTKWLCKHNPHGLHTIQLQTLSKLRCTVDDLWPVDVPAFLELFGKYNLMPWVADIEGGQRQQEYQCKLVEQKEGCRFIFTELFGMDP
ncbi:hypothetical protein BT96DRAFT_934953 [Gymnopus androsaceus JB14]|uniref:Uncharacterized protein n=1 Tax=Gymnopus androsaceus JB14 TaxID=1447944 RepID=A0A6A4I7U9_9AGAR|nr:hypothetical protein BT96DRAFT_934953 [Gymnopus androsaceus JB14]